jgi:hypothetical protein
MSDAKIPAQPRHVRETVPWIVRLSAGSRSPPRAFGNSFAKMSGRGRLTSGAAAKPIPCRINQDSP